YPSNLVVLRTTTSGALDATFDGDGMTTFHGTRRGDDSPAAMARQSDGKLLVLSNGPSDSSNRSYCGIMRFNPDGTVDETFGIFGTTRFDNEHAYGLALSGDRIESNRVDRKSTRLNSSHSQISYAVF